MTLFGRGARAGFLETGNRGCFPGEWSSWGLVLGWILDKVVSREKWLGARQSTTTKIFLSPKVKNIIFRKSGPIRLKLKT
jgi:hypothetical protein